MQLVTWLRRSFCAQVLVLFLDALCRCCCRRQEPALPFMLLCAPRCGSTLLVEALEAHPEVSCRGEVLNPEYEVYGDVTLRGWWRVRAHWLAMFAGAEASAHSVGVKMFCSHTAELACGATVAMLLDALPRRPVLLVLHRRCMLSSYLSLCRAFETDVWFESSSDMPSTAQSGGRGTACAAGLARYCADERANWQDAIGSLADAGWRAGELTVLCYEDDIDHPSAWRTTREAIASRLGVSRDEQWLAREQTSSVQRRHAAAVAQRENLLEELRGLPPSEYELDLPAMINSALRPD